MAMKTKDAPKPVENPLAHLGIENPIATAMEAERREFLPYIKIAWSIEEIKVPVVDDAGNPVMASGKQVMESATGKLVVSGGGLVQKIAAPFLMTSIVERGGTRELVTNATGKQEYRRTFATLRGAQRPEHIEQLKRAGKEYDGEGNVVDIAGASSDPKILLGNSSLVAILNPAEGEPKTVIIGLLEAFKTQLGYWADVMNQAVYAQGFGVVIGVEDHSCNMTASRANPTNKYYDRKKFTQWKQAELTQAQKSLLAQTLMSKKAAVDAWFNR